MTGIYAVSSEDIRICMCTVGLPARGKTYIAEKDPRYLSWLSIPTKSFNVGNYRRKHSILSPSADFFDMKNPIGEQARRKAAEAALADMMAWFKQESGVVGILDATNSRKERRRWIRRVCQENNVLCILLDVLSELGESYRHYIDFKHLQSIIVDEADYVLKTSKHFSVKKIRQNRHHFSPGQILLQYIITSRNKTLRTKEEFLADNYKLICSSATLDKGFKRFIYSKNWNRYQIISSLDMTGYNIESNSRVPFKIKHYVLKIVLPEHDKIHIMDVTLPLLNKNRIVGSNEESGNKTKEKKPLDEIFMIHNPKNVSIHLQDIIITTLNYLIKLENVKKAIIFISDTISKREFVERCQSHGLSSATEPKETTLKHELNQDRIYVMNYLSARGVDLPAI
ncbi:hypothetical protein PCK2_000812 [Pneumocystis canis]|nr:hypothetical protein PCK2_000812 [Pneumocystis canis]